VAQQGWRLLEDYRFEMSSGLWRHRLGAVEPPLRLSQIGYDADGSMSYPRHADRAPESDLRGYLEQATALFEAAAARAASPVSPSPVSPSAAEPASLSADLEGLRWFDLPEACLLV
jgi:hypothetical protein